MSKAALRMAQPHSRFGVALQRALLGLAATPPVRKLVVKALAQHDELDLPNYA